METVTVIERWWPGNHERYIVLKSGEKIMLEKNSERPPFVLMEKVAATIAGSAVDWR